MRSTPARARPRFLHLYGPHGETTEAALNTTGLVFRLYRDHFGTVPVEVGGKSPPPAPKYPVGSDQPKQNAGGPTYPVDVSAALTGLTRRAVQGTETQVGEAPKAIEAAPIPAAELHPRPDSTNPRPRGWGCYNPW